MKLIDWILLAAVALVVYLAIRTLRHSNRKCDGCSGGGCCGSHEPPVKLEKPRIEKGEKLSEKLELPVAGMTCENCARRVQNALHEIPGVKARVSISEKKAFIECREEVSREELKNAIRSAGYSSPED